MHLLMLSQAGGWKQALSLMNHPSLQFKVYGAIGLKTKLGYGVVGVAECDK